MTKDYINDQIVRLKKQFKTPRNFSDHPCFDYNTFLAEEISYWERELRLIERDEKKFEEYLEEPEQENYIEPLGNGEQWSTSYELKIKINEIIEVLNKLTKDTK